jgi:DNA helicase-2/ATP-dependent DNA helicase PcrA
VSFLRIINTPARGIGRATVEQIEQHAAAAGISLWTAMEQMIEERKFPARAESALQAFHRLMEHLGSGVESRKVADTLRAILDLTGYRQGLEHEGTEEAQGRIANLDELLNAAADADERGESLRDFLDHAALISDADQVDEKAPVSLLTMHNAKGLEFPIVFIAGMEEGLFPHKRSLDMPEGRDAIEEERRLCYVAMTRAEKKLYLSWARYRRRFGGGLPEASVPSRFLKETPATLIEKAGVPREAGIDLYAEQHMVRESARRNLYTGKTYNSVEAIRQFFSGAGATAGGTASATAPPVKTPAQPVARKKTGPGATIEHSKYGRGTILRVEGSGEDAKVSVSFPGYGIKKLVAKYAGIKVE